MVPLAWAPGGSRNTPGYIHRIDHNCILYTPVDGWSYLNVGAEIVMIITFAASQSVKSK